MASGGPGNRFSQYNHVFLYYNKGPFFPIIYYPYSPVKFPIPLVDAVSLSYACAALPVVTLPTHGA